MLHEADGISNFMEEDIVDGRSLSPERFHRQRKKRQSIRCSRCPKRNALKSRVYEVLSFLHVLHICIFFCYCGKMGWQN